MRKTILCITYSLSLAMLLFIAFLSIPLNLYAQQDEAKVYIVRKSILGAAIKFPLIINNMQLDNLGPKKYIECIVPPGEVSISVLSENNNDIKFVAEKGRKYYVQVNVSMGLMVARAKLALIKEDEGEKLVKKFKCLQFADFVNSSSGKMSPPSFDKNITQDSNLKVDANVAQSTPEISSAINNKQTNNQSTTTISDVDINIPLTKNSSDNTFVLIIANEDYEFVDNVQYALNDGEIFREYCIKTLGVPERQVWLYKNASLGIISRGVNKMVQAMNIFNDARAIVYYCGHGIPDEKTGDAYIVPVDGTGADVTSCYSLNKLYQAMGSAKTSNVTYFLDACFTGANRGGSMLVAARGVARRPKKETIMGNAIVFSAASGDETAMPFKEKGHGLFTYFLLKKLQESKGNVTYGELSEYINENVKKEAFLTNEKPQNPVVATSDKIASTWKKMSLK